MKTKKKTPKKLPLSTLTLVRGGHVLSDPIGGSVYVSSAC